MQGEYRGDFTRDTFDPTKHFSRVLMQQGRVHVDADWNEQASILLHYLRTLATDLHGPHWGPRFVDGESNDGFLVGKRMRDGAEVKNDFVVARGRYYVDGILCENDQDVAYREQPEFPFEEEDQLETGVSLVYLDVWERHITAADDGSIRETALGGPDTATRAKIVWHVKVLPPIEFKDAWDRIATINNENDRRAAVAEFLRDNIASKPPLATTGKLRARARMRERSTEPCSISPESRYRGLENHLYRVEIHTGGRAWDQQTERNGRAAGNFEDAARFKWSSDNSSVFFPILSLSDGKATLASLGRDAANSLRVNDWVEILDDGMIFRGVPGELRQIASVDNLEMSVTLKDSEGLPEYDPDSQQHPVLRRWDFRSEDDTPGLPVIESSGDEPSDWITLEDGIQIQFPAPIVAGQALTYRQGDYWLIPARTATGDIEWKTTTDDGETEPAALPPHGIDHHYAPLAVIDTKDTDAVEILLACRNLVP